MKNSTFVNLVSRRRRQRTSTQERQQWAKAWERSDQTQAEFAAANGLSVGTLRNWIRDQAGQRCQPDTLPAFREISIGDFLNSSGGEAPAVWEAEIRLPGGVAMAVAPGVAIDRVKELLEALRC